MGEVRGLTMSFSRSVTSSSNLAPGLIPRLPKGWTAPCSCLSVPLPITQLASPTSALVQPYETEGSSFILGYHTSSQPIRYPPLELVIFSFGSLGPAPDLRPENGLTQLRRSREGWRGRQAMGGSSQVGCAARVLQLLVLLP